MKVFDKLTNKNFKLYAAQHYNNPECTDVEEFQQDLNRFKYLKRLLTRYDLTGELQERLILNHLIVLYNVFGIKPCNRMILFKINDSHYHYIKPFLVYLHYLAEDEMVDVGMDPHIVNILREV
tara:strand:- start:13596 stop:13964 length:369 start_codon:yes stop_codon:yes gene_type:complete